jgi:primosomal protein N' (replication factor Y) (superfamily II helicase)
MSVLRLAIPSPLRSLFDYLPPEGIAPGQLQPGQRLRVPFGHREVTGYLLEVARDSEFDRQALKPAAELLDETPLLPSELLQLCQWAARYYMHPAGEVMAAAFPKALREGQAHRGLTTPGWQLTTRGKGLPAGALVRSPKQSRALALLQEQGRVSRDTFLQESISRAILKSLGERGLVETCELAQPQAVASCGPGLQLNPEQGAALEALREDPQTFHCHLLEGVTGSGKTEVYLQLIADCLERGEQALVLIPEIGLTPQTLARFEQRFSAEIAVLHSNLGDARRYRAWEAARSGRAHIVIGTRSAVFTPLARPGLIVVDEEHDSSFKQQDGFRYSARDVAVKRGQLASCPVLLGSATPSLESLHNALQGRYQHHRLTQRAGGSTLPGLRVLDVRKQVLQAGLSEGLVKTVEHTLAAGAQCLLFLNRRGFAPTLQCHDCGWLADCEQCDARLTLHRRQRRLRCHHCGLSKALPPQCPQCHGQQLLTQGLGTEQTEDFLRKHFDSWPIYRVDSDSMQGREAMQSLVDQVNSKEPCILLGTQMLTKGHHFPGVALVGVIDMDAMLFSTDFRGEERAAQLLTQVAGRAGREGTRGEVILQSHHPDHPSLQAMLQLDYHEQALALLQQRDERGLPPVGRLAILRTDCTDAAQGERFLRQLRESVSSQLPSNVQLIGPLPAPMQRRAGRFRSQLLVHSADRQQLQQTAAILVQLAQGQKSARGLNWSVDIDPQDMF